MEKKLVMDHEEVLITGDQDVINEKLADGTYVVKMAIPLANVEMQDQEQHVIAMGHPQVCYVLVKTKEAE
ncbi:MAG: hypothetical protein NC218_01470 [Acetobacter sp.]|nr:hypothetical protein [Acetobacter sp.]